MQPPARRGAANTRKYAFGRRAAMHIGSKPMPSWLAHTDVLIASAAPPRCTRPYLCPDGTTGYRTTRGWYRRSDRNGWRPAAPHLLFDPEQRAALGLNGGAASGSGGCGWGTSGAMQLRCRHDRKQRRRRRPRLASTSRCVIGETDGCESGRDLEMGGRVNHSSKKARSAPVTHHSPLVRRWVVCCADAAKRAAALSALDWRHDCGMVGSVRGFCPLAKRF
jgi:hypothetical protein